MYNEDRYHTTDWDAGEISREETRRAPGRETPPQRGGASRPQKQQKQKKKRMHPFLKLVIWLAVVAVASVTLASVGWSLASDFAALDSRERTEIAFEVPEEWFTETRTVENSDGVSEETAVCDMDQVASALKEAGLIRYPWFFKLFGKFYNADEKIAQGTYTLNTEMDYMALVRGMRSVGGAAVTVDVSIPEGYTVQDIIDLLAENGVGSVESLTDVAENYEFEGYAFLSGETGSISRLEGYLFPDTYNFYVGGQPELAFEAMLSNFDRKVVENEDLTELFAESPYELSDIITVASLIEKETDGADRDKIASVIYNRLNNEGETAYFLQIDAALVYAKGAPITQADYTDLDSPYNLYQHTGLPPTPISNPGVQSIRAALQPADTDYYYYALVDGAHVFSRTLAEHNAVLAGQG